MKEVKNAVNCLAYKGKDGFYHSIPKDANLLTYGIVKNANKNNTDLYALLDKISPDKKFGRMINSNVNIRIDNIMQRYEFTIKGKNGKTYNCHIDSANVVEAIALLDENDNIVGLIPAIK